MRGIILVSDEKGRITKYVPEPPKSAKKEKKATRKNASKPISTPKCDALAAKMPPCVVPVVNLSKADVAEINAKLERGRKLRLIENKNAIVDAEEMRSSSVALHRMSDAEMTAAVEKVKLRKKENASLSCKIFLLSLRWYSDDLIELFTMENTIFI